MDEKKEKCPRDSDSERNRTKIRKVLLEHFVLGKSKRQLYSQGQLSGILPEASAFVSEF